MPVVISAWCDLQAAAGDEDAAMRDLNERERRDIEEEHQANGEPDSSDDEADSVDEHMQVRLPVAFIPCGCISLPILHSDSMRGGTFLFLAYLVLSCPAFLSIQASSQPPCRKALGDALSTLRDFHPAALSFDLVLHRRSAALSERVLCSKTLGATKP